MHALLNTVRLGFIVCLSAVILLFGATEIFAPKADIKPAQKTVKLQK